tara:strand:- start:248 stop:508 length:261 start_codon:yes stop_codon:yes gene_type:complete
MAGLATGLGVVANLDLRQEVDADGVEGEVFRVEEVYKPWVPRSMRVEALAVLMQDTEGTSRNEGGDESPLMRGNMGKITTPATLES